ncbi:DoxX family protein [Mucilaginibacter corticis]|uniref:DoxX family protein n=1 Tax=Mucilaginibacter corticis TaxID=2597670 RepID=A0A556MXB7_9SPHI|nr:DoxX family protein [Mucilaginibacter corticis]TSJ44463.1 DoxX family protein [Mucilaginibacter corticis]
MTLQEARQNRWMRYFTTFVRVALAFGFFTAGMVKIMGERFASGLSVNHPMGHYLEALSHTGNYYLFIGIAQVLAAVLLLIPRTALLGAILYFPVILNICILSLAVRFEGSLITSPLMVLANLYLLLWDCDKLKPLFQRANRPQTLSNQFPWKFFAAGLAIVALVVLILTHVYDIMPRNSLSDCETQCKNSKDPAACKVFCEGIHSKGEPLDKALDDYHRAIQNK